MTRIALRDRNQSLADNVTRAGLKVTLEEILKQLAEVINWCRLRNYPADYTRKWEVRFEAVNAAIAEFDEEVQS